MPFGEGTDEGSLLSLKHRVRDPPSLAEQRRFVVAGASLNAAFWGDSLTLQPYNPNPNPNPNQVQASRCLLPTRASSSSDPRQVPLVKRPSPRDASSSSHKWRGRHAHAMPSDAHGQ